MFPRTRGARQLGAHSCCANRAENALGGCILLKAEAGGGQERVGKCLTIGSLSLAPVGEGGPGRCRATKRQCGLVTVRGKHMATNGTVMGGEETWEKLVQESWRINSGGMTSPWQGDRGHSFTLPEMFLLPGLRPGERAGRETQAGPPEESVLCGSQCPSQRFEVSIAHE